MYLGSFQSIFPEQIYSRLIETFYVSIERGDLEFEKEDFG